MDDILIEKGIPIPNPTKGKRKGHWQNLLNKMQVGDSVVLDNADEAGRLQRAGRGNNRFKVITRVLSDGIKIRAWKIKAEEEGKENKDG